MISLGNSLQNIGGYSYDNLQKCEQSETAYTAMALYICTTHSWIALFPEFKEMGVI